MMRGLAGSSHRLESRSRYNSLSPSGKPPGMSAAVEGPASMIGSSPIHGKFLFDDVAVGAFP